MATSRSGWPHNTTWPTTPICDIIHKPEVHNLTQSRHRRTKPQPRGICTLNFGKIGSAVQQICSRTDRHTNRRIHRSQYSAPSNKLSHQFSTDYRCRTVLVPKSDIPLINALAAHIGGLYSRQQLALVGLGLKIALMLMLRVGLGYCWGGVPPMHYLPAPDEKEHMRY